MKIRRWFWRHVARYRYELCQRCGRRVSPSEGGEPLTYWQADDALWLSVHGQEDGIRCPDCFTRDALTKGVRVRWVAVAD